MEDADTVFIGQWEITQTDDYNSQKAGTVVRNAVVRSRVDHSRGVIILFALIHDRNGTNPIPMDGSTGLYGKITERIKISDTFCRTDFLWIKLLTPEQIAGLKDDKIKTVGEIDDIVYNPQKKYTFDVVYFVEGSFLRGMMMEMEIEKFNDYVRMRDLWYKDYQGSRSIVL